MISRSRPGSNAAGLLARAGGADPFWGEEVISAFSLETQSLAPFGLRLRPHSHRRPDRPRLRLSRASFMLVAWISAMMCLNVTPSTSSETSRYLIFPSRVMSCPF